MQTPSFVVALAMSVTACGTSGHETGVAADGDAADRARRDGPITAAWRAEACRGRALGAERIAVVGMLDVAGEEDGEGDGARPSDAAPMSIAVDGEPVPLSVPTLAIGSSGGVPLFSARVWTLGEARRAGFDRGWNLVAFEGDCGSGGAIAPVTRLRRIDGTRAFERRLGDAVRALQRSLLADVTRDAPAMPKGASPVPGLVRRVVAASAPSVLPEGDGVTVTSRVAVRYFAPGYACPPGADNPHWRMDYGFEAGTAYARVCTLSRGNDAPVCRDLEPVAIPRPRCPPLP